MIRVPGIIGRTAAVLSVAAAMALGGESAATAAEDIGAVSDLRLIAYGTPPASARAPVFHRDGIVIDEELETVEDAALRVVFIDETVLDMGGSARLLVDEMVFDPAEGTGNSLVNLLAGSFFYVSGKMPHENIRLETPTAIIGVRGTELSIDIEPDGATAISVIDGEVQFTSKTSGESAVVSEGSNIEISAGGRLSPVRFGLRRSKDRFMHKVATLSAQKKFQAMTTLMQQIQASGGTPPSRLVDAAKEMAVMAAEIVLAPGNYGEETQAAARAVLANLPADVNIAAFVQSVDNQNRVHEKFRLQGTKKIVLANRQFRRLPDGTIQQRKRADAQDGEETSPKQLVAEKIRALVGAGASKKQIKKITTNKKRFFKCKRRPKKCKKLLGL